jgi:glycosyltransferase involved in cell wall biosynthesis
LPGVHQDNVWLARSPRALADGLIRLLGNRQLRERIGESARQTATRRCSWDRAVAQLERLCMELVTVRARSGPYADGAPVERVVCPMA